MKTRKWKAEEKLAIVLCGIKGEKSVAEICREHQISQTQYYKWRDKFFEGALSGLNSENNSKEKAAAAENEKLKKIIGEQAMVIDTLKKNLF